MCQVFDWFSIGVLYCMFNFHVSGNKETEEQEEEREGSQTNDRRGGELHRREGEAFVE
jgi:hypothetical protein